MVYSSIGEDDGREMEEKGMSLEDILVPADAKETHAGSTFWKMVLFTSTGTPSEDPIVKKQGFMFTMSLLYMLLLLQWSE